MSRRQTGQSGGGMGGITKPMTFAAITTYLLPTMAAIVAVLILWQFWRHDP